MRTSLPLVNRTRDKMIGHVHIPANPSSQMLVKQESIGDLQFKVRKFEPRPGQLSVCPGQVTVLFKYLGTVPTYQA